MAFWFERVRQCKAGREVINSERMDRNMKKTDKKTLVLTSIIILIPVIVGCVLWAKLPDSIPTHFGMDGTPNGWSSKPFTVFGIPCFLLGLHWLCLGITSQDPKYQNMNNKLYALVVWTCPITSLFLMISYGTCLGWEVNITKYVMIGVGVLFMIVGNYLPKCKQNYTMGIKLPWTLDSEENWNHTHRFAGFLWVAGGVLVIINAFIEWEWLFLVIVAVMVLVPTVYSFLYYKRSVKP